MNITKELKHKLLLMLFIFLVASATLWSAQVYPDSTRASSVEDIYVKVRICGREYLFRQPDIRYLEGADKAFDEHFEKDFRGRITRQKSRFVCSYYLQDIGQKLQQIAQDIYQEPVSAEVLFSPDSRDMFEITPDAKGRRLDTELLAAQIAHSLKHGRSFDREVQPEQFSAPHTYSSLKKSTALRQEFITYFPASSPQRKHNIALSLRHINGTVLAPGEVFSFNDTVGPRTEERGFKTAKIIVNGEFVEGTGGGVCQTSTTLYNAAVLAGLKIREQHRHSLAVSYVRHSFDAMVNAGSADLKIENDTQNYIYIKAFAQNNSAVVRIYGQKNPYKIVRKSVIVKTHTPPKEKLVIDTEGKYPEIYKDMRKVVIASKPKVQSIGILEYYQNGKLVDSRQIRSDTYAELAGLEIVGTTQPPDEPLVPPPTPKAEE